MKNCDKCGNDCSRAGYTNKVTGRVLCDGCGDNELGTPMNHPTTLTGVATAIEWQGKTIVVTADDLQTLKAYLEANDHEGHPEARSVAVVLGPLVELHPISELNTEPPCH